MKHIQTKLALSLLLATLLLIIPSHYLVERLLESSINMKFNNEIERAVEEGAWVSKKLHSVYKDDALITADQIANSSEIKRIISGEKISTIYLTKNLYKAGISRIAVYNSQAQLITSIQDSIAQPYPVLSLKSLQALSSRKRADFISEGTTPNSIFISAPVVIDDRNPGFITVFKVLDEQFAEYAQHIIEVNQMFKTLNVVGGDPKRPYLIVFSIVFILIASLSIAVGFFFSRRITSPLLELVRATKIVSSGNWDYRMAVKTQDEIGQLVEAFNQMVQTIKEKQQLVLEEEHERRRIEKESERKAKDLEMAQLRGRALQAENERKSIELEKARELEKAYQALAESHRQLKETQAKLVQTAKMASLGNLAAGIAHEINNPIGAINSAADVSQRAVKKILEALATIDASSAILNDKKFNSALKILQENTRLTVTASSRVVKIVRSLKTFARLDEANYQSVDIHEGIDSTLMLLQHEIKNRVDIRKEYGDLPRIACYPDELNQVFMNIISNSVQAIEEKGIIQIRTRLENSRVFIEFEDTGPGIKPEHLEQIFDPGFTTKGVGVGTGLGLSISYNIIQKHNGEIRVESEPGEGTKFIIELPYIPEEGENNGTNNYSNAG